MNNSKTYANTCSFNKETGDIALNYYGAYSDSTDRLHSVGVHDVTNIVRKTKTLKGTDTKVTTIELHTATGIVTIDAFRTEA